MKRLLPLLLLCLAPLVAFAGLKEGSGRFSHQFLKSSIAANTTNGFAAVHSFVIDHTKVSPFNHTNLTNYPVMIYGSYSWMATVANGGLVNNTTTLNNQTVPADLVFTSDAGCSSPLVWEIGSYMTVGGITTAEIYVKVPTLSASVNTTIYACAGKSSVTTYQATACNTWNSNYAAVYHTANGSTLSAIDSTCNGNNGTVQGATATTGEIDGGASFNGTNANIDLGSASSLNILGPLTIQTWFNPTALPSGGQFENLVSKHYNGTDIQFSLDFTNPAGTAFLNFYTFNGTANIGAQWAYGANLSTGTWYHGTGVFDGSNWIIYINGVQKAITANSQAPISSGGDVLIGAINPLGRFWPGLQDEVRILSTGVSQDWDATDTNDQGSPSTFYTAN